MSRQFLTTLALSAVFSLAALPSFADSGASLDSISNQSVPAGKSLVIPLTASNSDGTPLSFTVTSSDPCVVARVKTGLQFLRLNITHTDSGQEGDSDYSGTLIMALFRDWTPNTAGIIGGLAQSGFYNDLTFHRLHNGSDFKIIQGGDPNGDGSGGPGFEYPDEYAPQLMFAGDAQLAMANSGHDTNGSQFFLTSGANRVFDFTYTIFGQLTRGRDILTEMFNDTAVNSESPDNPVTISSATVLPRTSSTNSDAILVLSAPAASGIGTSSTITVTVNDGNGHTDQQTFTATPTLDTTDDPPFLAATLPDKISPAYTIVKIPMSYIDLEDDPVAATGKWLSATPNLLQSVTTTKAYYFLTPPSFTGSLELKLGFYEVGTHYRGGSYDSSPLTLGDTDVVDISVGDSNYTLKSMVGNGLAVEKGTAINQVLAKIVYANTTVKTSHFGATINWGDDVITVGTITKSSSGALVVSGNHTYSTAGTYPVKISVYDIFAKTSAAGVKRELDLTACITDSSTAPLAVQGLTLTAQKSPKSFTGTVATFSDVNASSTAVAGDYTALIDWGDGNLTAGTVGGSFTSGFTVTGTHTYTDSDAYSVATRIVRTSDSATGYGYGRMVVSGSVTTMPPFRNVDLQGKWLSLKTYNTVENSVTVGHIIGQFKATNTGTVASPAGTATLYYSTDAYYDDGTDINTSYAKDTQLGQVTIPALQPGKSSIIYFVKKAVTGKNGPVDLPDGVDMTSPSTTSSTIITRLQATYPSPQLIDVTHNIVARPSK